MSNERLHAMAQHKNQRQAFHALIPTIIKNDRWYGFYLARRRPPTRRAYHPAQILKRSRFTPGGIIFLLLGLSSLFPGSALSATPPSSGDEVRVIVKGVAVPYSVFGIIKRLEQIPGVATVNFDMRHGLADIKLLPGAHISDEQLRAAIKNASYTPGDIHWVTPENDPARTPKKAQPPQ